MAKIDHENRWTFGVTETSGELAKWRWLQQKNENTLGQPNRKKVSPALQSDQLARASFTKTKSRSH